MKLAVLDLGSNSFHLAIYRWRRDGDRLLKVARVKEMCRLGAGTLWNGLIDDAAWRRGVACLARLHRRALEFAPDRLAVIGTAGIREAANGAEFCREARARLGVEIEVVPGELEASLVYWGAREAARTSPRKRIAVIDVGGGSAEIAVGDGRTCLMTRSLPLGVLRLRDAPGDAIALRVRAIAEETMVAVRALAPEQVLLTSGTARRLSSVALGLGLRSADREELGRVALSRLRGALPRLGSRELAELGVEEARRDTIAPGAIVLDTLVDMTGVPSATVVSSGLREGVALRELAAARADGARPRRWLAQRPARGA